MYSIKTARTSVILRPSDGMLDHVVGDIARFFFVTKCDLPKPIVQVIAEVNGDAAVSARLLAYQVRSLHGFYFVSSPYL